MDEQRLEAENAFILANRVQIAAFGQQQYEATEQRGIVLVQRAAPTAPAEEMRYLTRQQLETQDLLGDDGPPLGQAVTQALGQYDPAEQIVLLFLYPSDGTPYLLHIERDLLSD